MKNLIFQNKLLLIGIVAGGVAGFLYWKMVAAIVAPATSLRNGIIVRLMEQ